MELLTITYIILGMMCALSLFNAIIWTHKNFLNFMVKAGFIIGTLMAMNQIFVLAGVTETSIVSLKTYMWFNVFFFGLLGFTWRSTGALNIFLKFLHMMVAFCIGAWLMVA